MIELKSEWIKGVNSQLEGKLVKAKMSDDSEHYSLGLKLKKLNGKKGVCNVVDLILHGLYAEGKSRCDV